MLQFTSKTLSCCLEARCSGQHAIEVAVFEYASRSRNVHNTCEMFACGQIGRRNSNMDSVLTTFDTERVAVSEELGLENRTLKVGFQRPVKIKKLARYRGEFPPYCYASIVRCMSCNITAHR
jgi:hypothetical protein